MDPLTELAAIKTGVAAGKQLHNLSKEIAGFFDATDGAKKAHAKKKNGIFASANEEAMATWTQTQNAKTAEAELREFIVNTKGFSAYQERPCQIKLPCLEETRHLATHPWPSNFHSAISKPAQRSSNLQLCCM